MASLGKDLAALRKEQGLSFDDIYEATKIPKHIISSIEDDSIFSDFGENPTYIRSYVRSYAKALAIDEQQIVYALNKQESDNYSGSLRQMGEEKAKPTFEYDAGTKSVDDDSKAADNANNKNEADSAPSPNPEAEASAPKPSVSPPPPVHSQNVDSVDWANMGRQFQPLQPKSRAWIGILIILFLGAGSLYFFISSGSNNPNSSAEQEMASQPPAQPDSLQLSVVPTGDSVNTGLTNNIEPITEPNSTQKSLSDTLNIIVYAAYGKLEPVRVYTDIMGSTNPYWIEQGEAVRFGFVNEFQLRGQSSSIVLLMNGHVIQSFREQFYNPDTRRIEINRSFFEDNPKWLQPAPDSLNIDAPPPAVIKERPTFN